MQDRDPREHSATARNTATRSSNRIHDDEVARAYGFEAGLVPGVVVYEHLCHPLVEAWGRRWLSGGSIRVRFLNPAYDGEQLQVIPTVTARSASGPEVEVRVSSPRGSICAVAQAAFAAPALTLPLVSSYQEAPLPQLPPAATEDAFRAREALGSIDATLVPAAARSYLESIGEELPLYRREGVVPPGHMLDSANRLLYLNFQLGPWIHASSEVTHFSPAVQGEPLQMRGRVSGLFERRGHRFVELDGLVVGPDRRPIAHVRHTAIYEPARPDP